MIDEQDTPETKEEFPEPPIPPGPPKNKGGRPKKRHHPYKGIPRDQWPKAKAMAEKQPEPTPDSQPARPHGVRTGELPADELDEIRARARKQADAERQQLLRDDAFKRFLAEERAKLDPNEEIVSITITVPAMSIIDRMDQTGITFNGHSYLHGQTYEVPLSLARDLQYAAYCANRNEMNLGNPSRDLKIRTRLDPRINAPIAEIRKAGKVTEVTLG